jgi:hypothetical protein
VDRKLSPRNRTIFAREWQAWVSVFVYTLILYSTLTLAFNLYVRVYDQVGQETVSFWMNAGFVAVGVPLILFALVVYRPGPSGLAALVLIGVTVALCLDQLAVPAKRFHFFQYAPLTVLVFDALRFRCRDRGIYVWTMLLVGLIGLGDETIQWLLPNRYFGVVDAVINAVAGLLTLTFIGFVMGEENYPLPNRKPFPPS